MASRDRGWLKLNTDGPANQMLSIAATGGVFRNIIGIIVGAFCCSINHHTAFFAEIKALIQGLIFTKAKGWQKIWIELDYVSVLQCLLNDSYKPHWSPAI